MDFVEFRSFLLNPKACHPAEYDYQRDFVAFLFLLEEFSFDDINITFVFDKIFVTHAMQMFFFDFVRYLVLEQAQLLQLSHEKFVIHLSLWTC